MNSDAIAKLIDFMKESKYDFDMKEDKPVLMLDDNDLAIIIEALDHQQVSDDGYSSTTHASLISSLQQVREYKMGLEFNLEVPF